MHRPDHQYSLVKYFLAWITLIVAFAVAYWILSYVPGNGPTQLSGISDPFSRFLTAVYFSVVTGATVGYGDIVPLGVSRVFAAVESILSFVLLAIFVSRIASRRQDAAINDIHSLARDSLFNNFRHGLFIARKDLDHLIEKVDAGESLSERDYRNLRTAFRQMQTHINAVPKLYGATGGLIDNDHEQLVLDSVERSLRRAREAVVKLEDTKNSCRTDEKCMVELGNIVHATHKAFVTLFTNAYNEENNEAFAEMLVCLDELRSHV